MIKLSALVVLFNEPFSEIASLNSLMNDEHIARVVICDKSTCESSNDITAAGLGLTCKNGWVTVNWK